MSTNQNHLYKKFKNGDIEIGVCTDCKVYYKQTFNPRKFCLSCLRKQPQEYRRDRHYKSRNMEARFRCELKGRKKMVEDRTILLKSMREAVGQQPELEHRILILGVVKKHVRNCLKCSKIIRSNSKYIRLCFECKDFAGRQGMQNETHYI